MKSNTSVLFYGAGLALIATIVCLLLSANPTATDANSTSVSTVDRVIDGDTIVLTDGNSVRLIGVDTPELHHPSRPIEYFAIDAKTFVDQMVKGREIKIVLGKERRDKYNRLLAYVYLPDNTFLNAEIIKQGYGFVDTRLPFEFSDDFVKYEDEARQAKRGLWAGNGLNELRWIKSKKRLPFEIYDLANNKWAIEYQGMAKTYLALEELNGELEFMRKAAYGLSPRDLRLECAKRGWHEIDPEKKGDLNNEKQTH